MARDRHIKVPKLLGEIRGLQSSVFAGVQSLSLRHVLLPSRLQVRHFELFEQELLVIYLVSSVGYIYDSPPFIAKVLIVND